MSAGERPLTDREIRELCRWLAGAMFAEHIARRVSEELHLDFAKCFDVTHRLVERAIAHERANGGDYWGDH